ncbi:MAG: glycosyltransferase family 9 protein [Desulfovibrionaceae bacterium]|nr:glycosyltransferase family 9 protein [Desulfovibrionaceae bacterium]
MNAQQAPSLVLQMQRMGDLILTFPLLARLRLAEPERPLWVVAEERFYKSLMPFAPDVVFFAPEAAPKLAGVRCRRVINLSHRPAAARLCAELDAEERFGMFQSSEHTAISGYWQLYRASLVHNNRHNRFHWSDLNILDILEAQDMQRMHPLRPKAAGQGRVGLFVGASEAEKRPAPQFWAELALALIRKNIKAVFLGGPEDSAPAAEAAQLARMPQLNLCGRFDLRAFAEFLRELDLLITPDTGPMHLAAWLGTPTLNLSLGPVHAWETGPAAPGHHVLRANISCSGCWGCSRGDIICRRAFTPARTALLAQHLLHSPQRLASLRLPGLFLCVTDRTEQGLFELRPALPRRESSRDALGRFWQAWFLEHAPQRHQADSRKELHNLAEHFPRLLPPVRRAIAHSMRHCVGALRAGAPLPPFFWQASPLLLRPFTSWMQLSLQNERHSKNAWEHAVALLEDLERLFR